MSPLLSVRNLSVEFAGDHGNRQVTQKIGFYVNQGEVLGIVGESGCGKSVTVQAMLGLLPAHGRCISGEAVFEGVDLCKLKEKELDEIRGFKIGMIFQDALSSLDPVFTVGSQLTETIRAHLKDDRKSAEKKAVGLLKEVGIPDPEKAMKKYPHELSGGQRQRVMIAIALSCGPKLLIADEPTTSLDMTIQAQIMDMIKKLMASRDMSMILISHDIGLIAQMADRVLVIHEGRVVEEAEVRELFKNPQSEITRGLLKKAEFLTYNTYE